VLADAVELKMFRATNAAAVAELPAVAGYQVLMSGAPSGLFEFSTTNFSAAVGNDPGKLVFIPPSFDATGASGAWVKQSGTEVGEVIMFAGNAASLNRKYGQGWRIADGSGGTPNLMDAFPKFGTFAQKSGTGGAKTINPAVALTVQSHTLALSQLPQIRPPLVIIGNGSAGLGPGLQQLFSSNGPRENSVSYTNPVGGGGSHAHGISGTAQTNEPQFTYLVPLYFTGIAGTYS
jgi:hypothetical protein